MSVSFKELYDVYLKATYPMEIGKRSFEVGEPVIHLDRIQIAGFDEMRQVVRAHGGFEDQTRIIWDTTKELRVSFQQGVFSAQDFALAVNSNLVEYAEQSPIWITTTEYHESNEYGKFDLGHIPCGDNLFVYKKDTNEKVQFSLNEKEITVEDVYTDYRVCYRYDDLEGCQMVQVGQRLTNQCFSLEGRTRVKDDTNGIVTSGLLVIPKFKLMSGLSIMLGAQATPVSAKFQGIGLPVGSRGNTRVCEFYFLNTDIDSNM